MPVKAYTLHFVQVRFTSLEHAFGVCTLRLSFIGLLCLSVLGAFENTGPSLICLYMSYRYQMNINLIQTSITDILSY